MCKIYFYFILFLLIHCSSFISAQDCISLTNSFKTYTQAINKIESTKFRYYDELPYGKSSWILKAKFYSCDKEVGYLVITTEKGKSYIHSQLPLVIWVQFRNANSSGLYYNNFIKSRFKIQIEK